MSAVLSTSHPKVIAFYEKYPLDFDSMNLIFVEVLEKVMSNMDPSLNASLANNLLDKFSVLKTKVENIATLFDAKMNEYRKEHIHDLKMILASNNMEQIAPLIRETNHSLMDKTSIVLNELLPKNSENISKDIQYHFQELQKSLNQETSKLLSSSLDKKGMEEFLQNIITTVNQSNQSLVTFVSSSETRMGNRFVDTDSKINEVKEILRENDFSQLKKNVTDVLNKFEFGVGKGTMSEHILYNLLLQHYKCAEIEYVAGRKETGDVLFTQKNRPKILIENKDHHSMNVPKADVDKFIRDCDIQNCCGIMLAQHRGISNKDNLEIQINNGNVLLYLHNVEFDIEKITLAIDLVENFKMKLDEMKTFSRSEDVIDKETLNEINQDFIFFTNQKVSLVKLAKEMNDKMLQKIAELKMPILETYLSKRFAFSSHQKEGLCKYCNEPIKKSAMQHYRYCVAKKEYEKNGGEKDPSLEEEEEESEPRENVVTPQPPNRHQCTFCKNFVGKSSTNLALHHRKCTSNPANQPPL